MINKIKNPSKCKHELEAKTKITEIEPGLFTCDLRVYCKECGVPFHFKKLLRGIDLNGSAMSFDGTEARLALGEGLNIPITMNKAALN